MEQYLEYELKKRYYLEIGGGYLINIIQKCLQTNGFDVIVYDFVKEEFECASIIVDYSFDDNINIEQLKKLTEQLFKRFNIEGIKTISF